MPENSPERIEFKNFERALVQFVASESFANTQGTDYTEDLNPFEVVPLVVEPEWLHRFFDRVLLTDIEVLTTLPLPLSDLKTLRDTLGKIDRKYWLAELIKIEKLRDLLADEAVNSQRNVTFEELRK